MGIGKRSDRKGIGLYTYEQVKFTSPFQYFVQIIVGTIVACLGGLLLLHESTTLHADIWGWITGATGIVIGLFLAHAGAIFYSRKIARRIFGSAHNSHESKKS